MTVSSRAQHLLTVGGRPIGALAPVMRPQTLVKES